MKIRSCTSLLVAAGLAAGLAVTIPAADAAPQPTSFTYQGSLADNGSPVDGATPMEFKLWDAPSGGSQVGATISTTAEVNGGVFSAPLDFGAAAFADSEARWLEIIVDGQSMGRTPLNATPYALSTRGLAVQENGDIGVGTRFPLSRLTIAAPLNVDRFQMLGFKENPLQDTRDTFWVESLFGGANGDNRLSMGSYLQDDIMVFRADGKVGIGTANPTSKLSIFAGGEDRVRLLGFAESQTQPEDGFFFESLFAAADGDNAIAFSSDIDTDIIRITRDGRIGLGKEPTSGLGTDTVDVKGPGVFRQNAYVLGDMSIGSLSPPATKLDVHGAVTIRGGADIVEGFDSACGTAFEPGTLLVIDPDNPGKLMCSDEAYDAKVAGIVSGAGGINAGMKLGQDGVMDGEIPVTMTGRVYVKATAENGSIEPGDRLTTSSVLGHAMKATDGDRSDGAVIGKAMSSLDDGSGLVLVLVNLQ
jgi:hypothetical protein